MRTAVLSVIKAFICIIPLSLIGLAQEPNCVWQSYTGGYVCEVPALKKYKSDDIAALKKYLMANVKAKDPYEKTADYENKVLAVLSQKVSGELTGKSVWTYYQPLLSLDRYSSYNPDSEVFTLGLFDRSIDTYTPRSGSLNFQADWSQLRGLVPEAVLGGKQFRLSFKVPPGEARDLESRLMLRVSFVPQKPYVNDPKAAYGLEVIFGLVESLQVLNWETGKVYFETKGARNVPVLAGYSRFMGVWTYTDRFNGKNYFRITKDKRGRFQFVQGALYEGEIVWSTDSIVLSPSNGTLHGSFSRSSQITLQFQPNEKVFIVRSQQGDAQKYYATKVGDK